MRAGGGDDRVHQLVRHAASLPRAVHVETEELDRRGTGHAARRLAIRAQLRERRDRAVALAHERDAAGVCDLLALAFGGVRGTHVDVHVFRAIVRAERLAEGALPEGSECRGIGGRGGADYHGIIRHR